MLLQIDRKELSRAQNIICDMIVDRSLVGFIREHYPDMTDTERINIHKMLHYNSTRPISRVGYTAFLTREWMPPIYWFYKTGEKCPHPLEFTPKKRTYRDLVSGTSIAEEKFNEYRKTAGALKDIAEIHGIPYSRFANYVTKKMYHGERVYMSFPDAETVRLLADVVRPDEWLIFPDELKKKKR